MVDVNLEELLDRQFNFENLGFNYLELYPDEVNMETYLKIIEFFNENVVSFENYYQIVYDPERIKLVAQALYQFLIAEIKFFIKWSCERFLQYLKDTIYDLSILKDYVSNSDQIKNEILKLSIVYDYIDTDRESFKRNWWSKVAEVYNLTK